MSLVARTFIVRSWLTEMCLTKTPALHTSHRVICALARCIRFEVVKLARKPHALLCSCRALGDHTFQTAAATSPTARTTTEPREASNFTRVALCALGLRLRDFLTLLRPEGIALEVAGVRRSDSAWVLDAELRWRGATLRHNMGILAGAARAVPRLPDDEVAECGAPFVGKRRGERV